MLTREQKVEQAAVFRDKLGRATCVFVADYRGITVGEANQLRTVLRSDEAAESVWVSVTSRASGLSTATPRGSDRNPPDVSEDVAPLLMLTSNMSAIPRGATVCCLAIARDR